MEVEQLIVASTTAPDSDRNARKIVLRRLVNLRKDLPQVSKAVYDLASGPTDVCLLRHHEEQLTDIKKALQEVTTSLLPLDLKDDNDLEVTLMELVKERSQCSMKLKHLLNSPSTD